MKLATLSLAVVGVFVFGNSYAMENGGDAIAKDLSQIKTLLEQAQTKAETVDNGMKFMAGLVCPHPELMVITFKESQEVINLADQAQGLAKNIIDNDVVSLEIRNNAQTYNNKALEMKKKYDYSKK